MADREGVSPAADLEKRIATAWQDRERLQEPVFRAAVLQAALERLRPGGVVLIPLATVEALADLRPLLEQAGLTVAVSQHQAWRGAPLADGTRLAPLNPVLVLRGARG